MNMIEIYWGADKDFEEATKNLDNVHYLVDVLDHLNKTNLKIEGMDKQEGKYTFKVNKKATKVDVANAVEKLFGVKVLRVNTITVKGKEKRVGRNVGRTSDWKKAIVTIDTNPSDKTYLAKGGKETKIATKYKTSIDEFMGA